MRNDIIIFDIVQFGRRNFFFLQKNLSEFDKIYLRPELD